MDQALQDAFEAIGHGCRTKIANELNITRAAVSQWNRVPPNRVIAIEKMSGISRHELRPDIYPIEEPQHEGA